MTMTGTDLPEIIPAARVTADYFSVFAQKPILGRTFGADEDRPGAPSVVVISHRLWASRYNSDRGIIGRALQLEGVPHTVIGVMPASFDYMREHGRSLGSAFVHARAAGERSAFLSHVCDDCEPKGTSEQARSEAIAVERAFAERCAQPHESSVRLWRDASLHSSINSWGASASCS